MADGSEELNPLYKDLLIGAVKYYGGIILASLATRHVITTDQSQQLLDDLSHKVVFYAPAVLMFAPIAWKIVRRRAILVTALWKAKMTEDEAKMMVKNPTVQTPTAKTPSDTVPGVPK